MSAAVLLVVSYTFALIQIAEGNPEELESFLLSLIRCISLIEENDAISYHEISGSKHQVIVRA